MFRIYPSCEFFSRSTVVFGISGRASASVEVFCSERPEVVLAVTRAPAGRQPGTRLSSAAGRGFFARRFDPSIPHIAGAAGPNLGMG